MKRNIGYFILMTALLLSASCKKFMTLEPEGAVRTENVFRNSDDAITAIYGLYGLMQPLVDQLFLAGEARADLVVSARGADANVREIAENRITASNPYTDYSRFYKLIAACNETLAGLEKISRIDPAYGKDIYRYNVAEVVYIRTWTYLQLVKIWGDVPYLDAGVMTADQVHALAPVKSEEILARALSDAERYFDEMMALNSTGVSGGNTNVSLQRGQFTDVSARCLLTELYVYTNNYAKAWETIRVFYQGSPDPATGDYNLQGVFSMITGRWAQWDITYTRRDVNLFIQRSALVVWFDGSRNQTNNLMNWTSNVPGFSYALKPSSNALSNWKTAPSILQQYQATSAGYFIDDTYNNGNNGFNPQDVLNSEGSFVLAPGNPGDYIRGEGNSYFVNAGDTLIFKYLMKERKVMKNTQVGDMYSNNDAFFNIYPDGYICLLEAEILNQLGLPELALQTFNGVANFAYQMFGTRYRVGVAPLRLDPNSTLDMKEQVDQLILKEHAMESAFEGSRWFNIVRAAKRSSDPDFLGKMVAQKYPENERESIRARLRDRSSWFFPRYQHSATLQQ